jgi:antitoxin VapB
MDLPIENPNADLTSDAFPENRVARLRRFLEEEVWPNVPPDILGKPISKEEEEEILGYGPDGV